MSKIIPLHSFIRPDAPNAEIVEFGNSITESANRKLKECRLVSLKKVPKGGRLFFGFGVTIGGIDPIRARERIHRKIYVVMGWWELIVRIPIVGIDKWKRDMEPLLPN